MKATESNPLAGSAATFLDAPAIDLEPGLSDHAAAVDCKLDACTCTSPSPSTTNRPCSASAVKMTCGCNVLKESHTVPLAWTRSFITRSTPKPFVKIVTAGKPSQDSHPIQSFTGQNPASNRRHEETHVLRKTDTVTI